MLLGKFIGYKKADMEAAEWNICSNAYRMFYFQEDGPSEKFQDAFLAEDSREICFYIYNPSNKISSY